MAGQTNPRLTPVGVTNCSQTIQPKLAVYGVTHFLFAVNYGTTACPYRIRTPSLKTSMNLRRD
jgi:hypothetical protein